MHLTVCAETLFADRPLAERFAAIRAAGISGVELWGIQPGEVDKVAGALRSSGCRLEVFCGNRAHSLIDAAEREGFLAELGASLAAARTLGCPRLTVLSDRVDERGIPISPARPLSAEARAASIREGLKRAAELAEAQGIMLLLEPLNTKVDHPGYTLDRSGPAFEVVRAIGSPRLAVLYDVYHMQVMEGNLLATMAGHLPHIGHLHVADVPGRHEPGTGEVNFKNVARMLRTHGYTGCIGLECVPRGRPEDAIAAFLDAFH
jgi:hydroxypyruvate isomerase